MTFVSATQLHSYLPWAVGSTPGINVKAVVSAFNQNKVPVEDFSAITKLHVEFRFV